MPLPIGVLDHCTTDVCDFDDHARPFLSRLDVRALIAAQEEQHVVLNDVWGIPPEHELHRRMGLGPATTKILFVPREGEIVADGLPIRGARLHAFSGTSERTRTLASLYQGTVSGCDAEVAHRCNLKSTLQTWGNIVIPIPEGVVVRDELEARSAIDHLFRKHTRLLFKPDYSASGIGQRHFLIEQTPDVSGLMYPGVIQAFFAHDLCVSIQFNVKPVTARAGYALHGPPVQLRELTGQHIKDGEYVGGFYPCFMLGSHERRLYDIAWRLVNRLVVEGYWGRGSVDFLVNTRTGHVVVSDLNCRITATWYPIKMSRLHHGGKTFPFDMRSFRVPVGMSASVLAEQFRGLLWKAGSGFVPFALLPDLGFCYGLTFGQSVEELAGLVRKVEERKLELL